VRSSTRRRTRMSAYGAMLPWFGHGMILTC
jgi:hypothetical protein